MTRNTIHPTACHLVLNIDPRDKGLLSAYCTSHQAPFDVLPGNLIAPTCDAADELRDAHKPAAIRALKADLKASARAIAAAHADGFDPLADLVEPDSDALIAANLADYYQAAAYSDAKGL